MLAAAGAEVVTFDPLTAASLPEGTDALVIGGGFPQVHVDQLTANAPLRGDIRRRAAAGMPIVAECAGLLWLGESLNSRPQCGLVPAAARMTGMLTLGYREATALRDTPLLVVGTRCGRTSFTAPSAKPAHGSEARPGSWPTAPGTAGRVPACSPPTSTCTGPACRRRPPPGPGGPRGRRPRWRGHAPWPCGRRPCPRRLGFRPRGVSALPWSPEPPETAGPPRPAPLEAGRSRRSQCHRR